MNVYILGMALSLALYIAIGFYLSKKVKDVNDFYVAGRRAPVLLITGSLIASYVSTGLFMGDAAEAYSGIFTPIMILATMQVVGYLYGAVYFGRYLRRSKVYTIPEFFEKRFNSNSLKVLAVVTAITTMIVYLLSVIQGIGTLTHAVTGVDYNLCITIALICFVLVSISAGAKGVLITDTIMFSIFTVALVLAAGYIIKGAGGWFDAVDKLVHFEKQGLISWTGNKEHLYPTGLENLLWAVVYGVVWLGVCMVGPWQSSRYLMAKNEHTVIRSALYTAFGVFMLELIVCMAAVSVNILNPDIKDSAQVLIWASMNVLPTFLGVLLLTGVLAAGISSATTFLSLIGTSIANDIFKDKNKNPILVGRLAMVGVGILVLILAIFNPPQIFWIMYFGGAIVTSSWMPVAIACIISKRVTKTGAFCGMLVGFLGCFMTKMITYATGIKLPVYLDPTIVGLILNIFALLIGSYLTKVTEEEIKARKALFIIPDSEKNSHDVKISNNYLKGFIILGIFIILVMLIFWAIPVQLFK